MGKVESKFNLESDKRFGPFAKIAELTRRNLKKHQEEQAREVDNNFRDNPSISLTHIIREPDASGERPLKEVLGQESEKPRIIILANGIVNPQDIVQISPRLTKFGMAGLKLLSHLRGRYSATLNDIIGEESISGYMTNTIERIQEELFNKKDCEVIIVRNASREDLISSVELGGSNTAVVVGGHGTISSVSMTDGIVSNDELETPEEPLKAFIQHTCAGKDDGPEVMGDRIAEKVYGWDREANPVDFIKDPLHERSMKV